MRKVRKFAIAAIAVLLIALQTFCVSAAYKKAYECTKDELYYRRSDCHRRRNGRCYGCKKEEEITKFF